MKKWGMFFTVLMICFVWLGIEGQYARGDESEKYLKWWERQYRGADDAVAGGVLYQRGEFEEAVAELEKAVNKGTSNGRVFYRLAYSCQQVGDMDKAIKYYRQAIKLLEEKEPKHRYDYYARYNMALVYKDREEGIKNAIDILKGAEKNHYQEPGLHNLLTWLYWESEDKNSALKECRISVDLDENQEDAQYNLGVIYFSMGKTEEAKRAFSKVVEINPENERTIMYSVSRSVAAGGQGNDLMVPEPALKYCYRGKQYLDQEKYREAALEYETALELAPETTAAHQGLGVVYEYNDEGIRYGDGFRVDKSIFHYRKALELDPKLKEAILNLAVLYSQQGDARQAERLYIQLLRVDPGNLKAVYNLAVLYDGQEGENQKAIDYYKRFLKLNPDSDQRDSIKERIGRLRH